MFFLMLALLFLFQGIFLMNLAMQLAGIVLLLFLIYGHIFDYKESEKYKKNYVKRINFIAFLGNIDLTLGVLLITEGLYGIIPMGLIFFLTIILFFKAFSFVWGGDIASMLDIISSVIIVSSGMIEIPLSIIILISIYLIQKGILSFFN